MSKLRNAVGFVQAVANNILPSAVVLVEAEMKLKICLQCPHGKNGNRCEERVEYKSEVTGQTIKSAGGCGCSFTLLHKQNKKGCFKNLW
tara:strand:- start:1146 stop:1412 length:267 start_codon:yes stop_codon:yes gene_type:complete